MAALRAHRKLVLEMQLRAPNWTDNDLVFPNGSGSALSQKLHYTRWRKNLAGNGIRARRLHDARHTAATLMHSFGVDIETIKRVLGHSSIALTSRT